MLPNQRPVNRQTLASVFIILSVVAFATMLTSCNGQGDSPYTRPEPPAATAPAPATSRPLVQRDPSTPSHGAQRQQLRELMKRMSKETQEHQPERFPRPGEEHRTAELAVAADQAARLAEELAAAAEGIPGSVRHLEMTRIDREDFEVEARTLRHAAQDLAVAARDRQVDQMQSRLDEINATCIACHIRFRDYIGDLDVQRASSGEAGEMLAFLWQ